MEERIKYKKQKYVYSARSENGEYDLIFPNIKAMVTWFADQSLFPGSVALNYNQVVDCLRRKKQFTVSSQGYSFSLRQLPIVGIYISSSKRIKEGNVAIDGLVEYNKKTTYVRGRYSCEKEVDGSDFRLCIDGSILDTSAKFSEAQAWVNHKFLEQLIKDGVVG